MSCRWFQVGIAMNCLGLLLILQASPAHGESAPDTSATTSDEEREERLEGVDVESTLVSIEVKSLVHQGAEQFSLTKKGEKVLSAVGYL